MNTLLLDILTWDLVVDLNGNIAMATKPYALAQDAASAIKLFSGELWYDTTQGVVYFNEILGTLPPLALLKQKFNEAALTVPEVTAARTFISSFRGRVLSGQVQITSKTGLTAVANF